MLSLVISFSMAHGILLAHWLMCSLGGLILTLMISLRPTTLCGLSLLGYMLIFDLLWTCLPSGLLKSRSLMIVITPLVLTLGFVLKWT
jgi:hypothetical protein